MKLTILALLLTSAAWGSATTLKQVDNIQNSTGGSSLAVPGTGTALTTDTNTQTLSNKTISGASNTLSNIPAATALSGQVPVANGGTGAASLTAHGVVVGNGTSAVSVTSVGTSGQVLTSNGAGNDPTFQTIVVAPTINASQASPQSVSAAGGISLTGPTYVNQVFVVSDGGSVTVTATPSITACTAAGQILYIVGESNTNIITLQDESVLSGSKLRLNGNWTSGLNVILSLLCDGNGFWVEQSRQN